MSYTAVGGVTVSVYKRHADHRHRTASDGEQRPAVPPIDGPILGAKQRERRWRVGRRQRERPTVLAMGAFGAFGAFGALDALG